MSYLAFTTELSDELGMLRAQSGVRGEEAFEQAHRRVFERWLAEGRHEALIKYVVENFDGAEGGENWMRRLGDALATSNRADLIRRLYEPVIARRRKRYFWQHDRLKPRPSMPKFVDAILDKVDGDRIRLATYKESILALMQVYRGLMAGLKDADLSAIDREIDAFARGEVSRRQPAARAAQRKMSKKEFWRLVGDARSGGATAIDAVDKLEASLGGLPPQDIQRFHDILNEYLDTSYRWDLWAVAYAVRDGCGDDQFDYFRAWLVLQGRGVYEAAMADPVAWALDFACEDDPQCEDFLSVAPNAYRTQTGEDMPAGRVKRRANPIGEAWSEATLAARFPALARRFDLGR